MLYYITLTTICNLNCKYCGNNPDPRIQPLNLSIPISDIKKFISIDPEPYICFYGGEPLLQIDLVKAIMNSIPAKKFILQTNGILLHKLEPSYIKRFSDILVSIDGRPEINDYYRGLGTYKAVLKNIKYIREVGFQGNVIARMAVSGKSDIYREVRHLVELDNPHFDYVHWQLDVMWDSPPYQRYENFDEWIENVYNPGISKLVDYWVNELSKGRFRGIIPFMGIMHTLLTGEKVELRCGSGINAFAITTDGRILACPIAPEFSFNRLGTIYDTKPQDLPYKVTVEEPCTSCEYLDICGGRCLFANKTKLWGIDGFRKVCKTVIHLINELKKARDVVADMVKRGMYSVEDFRYPKYPNSIEVIP